jgi:hypothetical protein
MKAIWLLALLLIASPCLAAEPFARVRIDDDGKIVPGQQVHVIIEVFVPDFFTSPPQFPLFDIPNAVVTLPDERAQNLVQTIDGVEYSGIRRRYAVVPEIPGTFTLPSAAIELGYSRDGKPAKGEARLPLTSFRVGDLAGAARTSLAFAARGLTVSQSFDREPSTLKVGDALVRTIVVFAGDTQAMMIPAVDLRTADGLRQYIKPPRIEDGVQVDRLQGSRRIETVVYTADKSGDFKIPAVSYSWFDLDGHAQRTSSLPATTVAVAAAIHSRERIDPHLQDEESHRHSRSFVIAVVLVSLILLGALGWLTRRAARRVFVWISEYRRFRRNSRRAQLRRLKTVILVGNEPAIYSALQNWSRDLGYRSISEWVENQDSPRLRAQIGILERRLFRSRDMQFDRAVLADVVGNAAPPVAAVVKSALPELNPTALCARDRAGYSAP